MHESGGQTHDIGFGATLKVGGRIMRVKRARGRIAPEEGDSVGGELATKLGSSY